MGELYHYGIKGMKWGVHNTPTKVQKKYHDWRLKRDSKHAETWNERANKTKFKSWANPLYVTRAGTAKGYENRAKRHQTAANFITAYLENNGSALSMISNSKIENGRIYVNDLLLDYDY